MRRAVLAALLVSACAAGTTGPPPVDLTVFAAASLRDALGAAAVEYTRTVPDVHLTITTDSSAALRTQIQEGARADLFLAADKVNALALADAGLADGRAVDFAANELALVVPAGNPAGIRAPADLARPGVKIVAAADGVPITAYVKDLLARLEQRPGNPPSLLTEYGQNVVSREDNVRAVLAKVELGEGDAGFVYATDARASVTVVPVPIPPGANVRATYAGLVVRGSAHAAEAKSFLAWLAGPAGQAVLARSGFLPLR